MCTCGAGAIRVDGFELCARCGIMRGRIFEPTPRMVSREMSRPPYSRAKRFMRLLHNSWGSRSTRCPDSLLEALCTRDPQTVKQIRTFIKYSSPKQHKRYDSLANLAIQLLDHRPLPLSQEQITAARRIFQQIEMKFNSIGGCFPAYSWIIEHILKRFSRPDLVIYLNLLKCPKRRGQYYARYGAIIKSLGADSDPYPPSRLVSRQKRVAPSANKCPVETRLAVRGAIPLLMLRASEWARRLGTQIAPRVH